MNNVIKKFLSWGIAAKLVTLFAIFGLVPMAAVGYLGASATGEMEDAAGARLQGVAENIADKIDRSLFERYGDVQVFGSNRIVGNATIGIRQRIMRLPMRWINIWPS